MNYKLITIILYYIMSILLGLVFFITRNWDAVILGMLGIIFVELFVFHNNFIENNKKLKQK